MSTTTIIIGGFKMFSKKIVALGLAASVVMASVSASAGTIGETSLTGTNAETGKYNIGDGDHVLVAKGTSGKGNASVKKVIKLFPDSTITDVSVSADNTASSSFTSVAKTDDGVGQSYYIKWAGNSSSAAAKVAIKHP